MHVTEITHVTYVADVADVADVTAVTLEHEYASHGITRTVIFFFALPTRHSSAKSSSPSPCRRCDVTAVTAETAVAAVTVVTGRNVCISPCKAVMWCTIGGRRRRLCRV